MAKTRRVYRLRALLRSMSVCSAWRDFVVQHETAEDVLAAINAAPAEPVPGETVRPDVGRAFWLRWEAYEIIGWLDEIDRSEAKWWLARRYVGGRCNDAPITPEEAERFRALWVRYADEHGLYEEVPV